MDDASRDDDDRTQGEANPYASPKAIGVVTKREGSNWITQIFSGILIAIALMAIISFGFVAVHGACWVYLGRHHGEVLLALHGFGHIMAGFVGGLGGMICRRAASMVVDKQWQPATICIIGFLFLVFIAISMIWGFSANREWFTGRELSLSTADVPIYYACDPFPSNLR